MEATSTCVNVMKHEVMCYDPTGQADEDEYLVHFENTVKSNQAIKYIRVKDSIPQKVLEVFKRLVIEVSDRYLTLEAWNGGYMISDEGTQAPPFTNYYVYLSGLVNIEPKLRYTSQKAMKCFGETYPSSVFELGSGLGENLIALTKRKEIKEFFGIEMDLTCQECFHERLKKFGKQGVAVNIEIGPFREYIPNRTYGWAIANWSLFFTSPVHFTDRWKKFSSLVDVGGWISCEFISIKDGSERKLEDWTYHAKSDAVNLVESEGFEIFFDSTLDREAAAKQSMPVECPERLNFDELHCFVAKKISK